jgi:hydroxylamine reductase
MNKNQMFCYQCEQTANETGCTKFGVCGKSPQVAALQDLLIYTLKGLSQVAKEAKKQNINDEEADIFTCKVLFSPLINVNFDQDCFENLIKKTTKFRDRLQKKVETAEGTIKSKGPASFVPKETTP